MTLRQIEEFLLINIKHTRYETLSSSTTAEDVEDFSMLHRCVLFARQEIALNILLPSLLKRSSANKTVANQKAYSLPSDFDLPVKIKYRDSNGEWNLSQVYQDNLLTSLGNNKTTTTGTPSMYMIFGSSSNLIQLELYVTPDVSNEEFDVEYLPILSEITTASDYDIIMAKYPLTVLKIATAYAFQLIKQNSEEFNKWFSLGSADFSNIKQRELRADSNFKQLPDSLIRNRRMARFSK